MSAQHTQGRLHVAGQDKVQIRSEKHQVAKAWSFAGKTGQENARRLVACWNACEGLSTEALECGPSLAERQRDELRTVNVGLMQAARQLLEAVEDFEGYRQDIDTAIADLREALEAAPEPTAVEQEPVLVVEREPSYMNRGHFYIGDKPHIDPTKVWKLPIGTKLYTAPQPTRQPLTDDWIRGMCKESWVFEAAKQWIRIAERAHGIGGEA